ncbi:MAG: Uma2 family endonuclease [Chloroflexi bacterium]|nr:Uma2 family endonuclease [Chloroflexota bacterium]
MVATQPERIILTYDDYRQLPEDGNRYELYEGEIEVTPASGSRHQRVVGNLDWALESHVRPRNLGTVLFAPLDVLLSETTVVQPDILFVAREREGTIGERYVGGPPDLVVEVLSPTTRHRDRVIKRQLYARFGVPHLWMLDPDQRRFQAFNLVEGGYQLSVEGQADETVSAAPFPDLTIRLGEVWA